MSGLPPPGIFHFLMSLARRQIEHGNAAFAAVRNVEHLGIAAHIKAVRAFARWG